jgi:hypothetical protein
VHVTGAENPTPWIVKPPTTLSSLTVSTPDPETIGLHESVPVTVAIVRSADSVAVESNVPVAASAAAVTVRKISETRAATIRAVS